MAWVLIRLSFAGAVGPESVIRGLQLPAEVEVVATESPGGWRFVVEAGRTRTLDVPIPRTEADQAAIVALVESLVADLAIPGRDPAAPQWPPV
ncbi:MAG: hypothetical protein ABMA64_31105, partial [Myxococcota bacterium]